MRADRSPLTVRLAAVGPREVRETLSHHVPPRGLRSSAQASRWLLRYAGASERETRRSRRS